MTSLADQDEILGVGRGSGVDGGGGVDSEGQVAAAVNQTGSTVPEHVVYNCRMCRRAVFSAGDIQRHEVAQHNFHRRKVREKGRADDGRRQFTAGFTASLLPMPHTGLSVSETVRP